MDVDFHRTYQDGGQGFHLFQTPNEDFGMDLVGQFLFSGTDFSRYFAETGTQVPQKLDEFFHCFDDFCHREIIEDTVAFADYFANFRFVKTEKQSRCCLRTKSTIDNTVTTTDSFIKDNVLSHLSGYKNGSL